MRLFVFILLSFSFIVFSASCKRDHKAVQNTDERLSFVNDSVPDLELVAKQLEGSSKETVTYELSILNHSSRVRTFKFFATMDQGLRCEGGSLLVDEIHCNSSPTYYQPVLAHESFKHRVELMRVSLRNPKFYWKLTEVEGINWDSAIVGTINLETH